MAFDVGLVLESAPALARGLAGTIGICLVSLPAGFLAGILLALLRIRGGVIASTLVAAYVELFRNIPFLIQVFLLFFVLPAFGPRLSPLTAAFLALSAYASAYSSEIFRAALLSIPKGQTEAGYALGLRYPVILRKILLPQALGFILPTSTNLAITLVKESAVLSTITVPELTYAAQNIVGRTFSPVEIFTAIALIYWALTASLSALTRILEVRLQPHLRAGLVATDNKTQQIREELR